MKRKQWIMLTVLVLCLVAFFGYRYWQRCTVDTQPPKITVAQEQQMLQVSIQMPDALLQGVTAFDDRDGDVTASVIVESVTNITQNHQVQVTYAAFDKSGNVAKYTRTVQYTDYRSPRFTLKQPLVFIYGAYVDVLSHVGAEDLLDGDIGFRVKATLMDETTITDEGIHMVSLRVTNSLGDTAELVVPVEVYYSGRYDAQLQLKEYITYLPAGGSFHAEEYLLQCVLSGQAVSLENGLPEGIRLETEGEVDTSTPGAYPVSYTITADRNGRTYTGYSKLIVVVEG